MYVLRNCLVGALPYIHTLRRGGSRVVRLDAMRQAPFRHDILEGAAVGHHQKPRVLHKQRLGNKSMYMYEVAPNNTTRAMLMQYVELQ